MTDCKSKNIPPYIPVVRKTHHLDIKWIKKILMKMVEKTAICL